jgi:hypothetical protein
MFQGFMAPYETAGAAAAASPARRSSTDMGGKQVQQLAAGEVQAQQESIKTTSRATL